MSQYSGDLITIFRYEFCGRLLSHHLLAPNVKIQQNFMLPKNGKVGNSNFLLQPVTGGGGDKIYATVP